MVLMTSGFFKSQAQNSILWSESSGASSSAQKTFCTVDLLDNAMTVGLNPDGGSANSSCEGNVFTFYADNTSPPCTLSQYNINPIPIGHLGYAPGGAYEIENDLYNGGVAPGTNLLLHVQGNFANGETIDQCLIITVAPNPAAPLVSLNSIAVDFRGNLLGQSTGGTYSVDFYTFL